ncbi:hypothetical protein [Chlorogloeopsis fritschii]|nr:hypothetical protein [Chlorogloeopsis fritschii]
MVILQIFANCSQSDRPCIPQTSDFIETNLIPTLLATPHEAA